MSASAFFQSPLIVSPHYVMMFEVCDGTETRLVGHSLVLSMSNIDRGKHLDSWTTREDQALHTSVHMTSLMPTDCIIR
jgi:hypothetical protein